MKTLLEKIRYEIKDYWPIELGPDDTITEYAAIIREDKVSIYLCYKHDDIKVEARMEIKQDQFKAFAEHMINTWVILSP